MFLTLTLPADARSLAPALLASDLHHTVRYAAETRARRSDHDSIAAVWATKPLVDADKRQKALSQQLPRDTDLARIGHPSSVASAKSVDDLTQSAFRRRIDERKNPCLAMHCCEGGLIDA
jgi:hypothetical protein